MSFARTISRGAFLKARFGVNGTQKASRSFGRDARGRAASDIVVLLESMKPIPSPRRRRNAPSGGGATRQPRVQYTAQLPHPAARPGAILKAEQEHKRPTRRVGDGQIVNG